MLYFPPIDFRRTPVTLVVFAASLALAIVCEFDKSAEETYFERLRIWPTIWAGDIWRPVTTTLLHGNLFPHALFNLYFLLYFGVALEERIGPPRMAGLLMLLASISSLAEYVLLPLLFGRIGTNVGLSGVVYGLFGLFWIGSRYRTEFALICPPQLVQWMLFWLVLCFVLTQFHVLHIANIAHAAGLGMGMLVGLAMFDVRRRAQWIAAVCANSGAVLATLVICPWHPGFRLVRELGLWWVQRLL
jgi:membrane associated rhomboid family serine protease